jgi:hypothetical protein
MNHIAPKGMSPDTSLSVSGWQKETHAGRETPFLCVYYDRFGFGMSLHQVEEAASKLDALLDGSQTPAPDGEIQIDRSGTNDGYIMIAFRPTANHASRYFDLPESAARSLLAKLREMLKTGKR